jgi:hypothetical protein
MEDVNDIQRAYNELSRNPSPRTRRHIHREHWFAYIYFKNTPGR